MGHFYGIYFYLIYELDETMIQKDDYVFANMLSHLATGKLTEEMNILFKSREINTLLKQNIFYSDEAIHLFYINAQKDEYNNITLQKYNTESYNIKALDICTNNVPEKAKKTLLQNIKRLPP